MKLLLLTFLYFVDAVSSECGENATETLALVYKPVQQGSKRVLGIACQGTIVPGKHQNHTDTVLVSSYCIMEDPPEGYVVSVGSPDPHGDLQSKVGETLGLDPSMDIYPFSAPLDFDINGVKAGSMENPLFCLTNEHPTWHKLVRRCNYSKAQQSSLSPPTELTWEGKECLLLLFAGKQRLKVCLKEKQCDTNRCVEFHYRLLYRALNNAVTLLKLIKSLIRYDIARLCCVLFIFVSL
ncbi:Arginine--tRNA ligase [Trichinella spiralis]|uniref:Arginine--tRNA ligase n=1 Tax=Trichinella spiralis TaxID=6334 RepID=A0ABR3K6Q6_TRISP